MAVFLNHKRSAKAKQARDD